MDAAEQAKELMINNKYLTLSTSEGNVPWISPLYYVIDDKWNLYFVSPLESRHAQHISKNPYVAFAIFDSTQEPGDGIGVQASARASIVESTNYPQIVQDYLKELEEFNIAIREYRVFRLEITRIFITDQEAWEKNGIDRRLEVRL